MPHKTKKQKLKAGQHRSHLVMAEKLTQTDSGEKTISKAKTLSYAFQPKHEHIHQTKEISFHDSSDEVRAYIQADLIKTLLIAGSACVILIILSFILH